MDRKIIDISWGSLWRVLFFVSFALLFFKGISVLLGLFLALVISSGIEFMVDFLEGLRIPRTIGVIMIFLVFALVLVFIVYAVIPLIIVDINSFFVSVPQKSSPWWMTLISPHTTQSLSSFVSRLSTQFLSQESSPFGTVSDLFGGVTLGFSILISSFYLSLSHDGVERFAKAVFPEKYLNQILRIYARSRKRVGAWFRTQIILSLTMGIIVWSVLFMMGVRHAFVLGFVAGAFELVPFIGPILAGAAAVLSAMTTSSALALSTLIAFVFIHQIESHFLVPVLTGKNLGLHPVIVIMALLIGAETGSLLGILISVPAAVVLQEVVDEWSYNRLQKT